MMYSGGVRCAQFTSSCVALHLPTRPHGVTANHRHSVIRSDLELAASIDEERFAVNVRLARESSTPRYDGKAGTKSEARRGCGDEGTRAAATKSVSGLIMAALVVITVLLGTYTRENIMVMGIIRIWPTRAASELLIQGYWAQGSESCVALHLPTRHNGVTANHRHSVIRSDLELAASIDEERFAVNVRPSKGACLGEIITCATLQHE
jgi:hypothetical protein